MTAIRPAPTKAQVEALGRDLCRSRGDVWPCVACLSTARAALASPVIGDLIADAWDEGSSVGWLDCAASDEATRLGRQQPDETPNPYRAAALSPTPADGTTSERSEA